MDLSELAPLVAAFVNRASAESVRQEALAGVLGVVTSGSASIEAIVSALGPHLTTTDELVRSKVSLLNLLATLLLAELLTRHASWSLTPQSIHSLVVFFSDRLQDYPCQTEVLNGIRALLSHHHIAPGDDHTLCRAIFSEVHVQTLPQTVRKTVFNIFDILLDRYLGSMKLMGADFVFGFIQCMDGEKDPRNLLLCFRQVTTIVRSFPEFIRFDEDLFEITSCYFPITFTERPNDPEAISKQELVDALRNCLASTHVFAPHVVPFLLDKLSSPQQATKIDVLQTLSVCVRNYGGISIAPLVSDIWAAVRGEIASATSAAIVDAAFVFLHDFIAVLDETPNSRDQASSYSMLLTKVADQVLSQLTHFDSKLTLLHARLLRVLGLASSHAARILVPRAVALVLDQHANADADVSKRHLLIRALNELVGATQRFPLTGVDHPLLSQSQALYDLYMGALHGGHATEEQVDAVTGLAHLSLLSNGSLLSAEQRTEAVTTFSLFASGQRPNRAVMAAASEALVLLALVHTSLVTSIALPKLFESDGREVPEATLQVLVDMARVHPKLFESILRALVDTIASPELHVVLVRQLVNTLAQCLSAVPKTDHSKLAQEWSSVAPLYSAVLLRLISLTASSSASDESFSALLYSLPPLLSSLSALVPHTELASLLSSVTEHLLVPAHAPTATTRQRRALSLYAAIVRAVPPKFLNENAVATTLLRCASDMELADNERGVAVEALAALVNATESDEMLLSFTTTKIEELLAVLHNPDTDDEKLLVAVPLLVGVVKALMARNHSKAAPLWQAVLTQLRTVDLKIAKCLAKLFDGFFADSEYLRNVRALYKQKFFVLALPVLTAGLKDNALGRQLVYLTAMTNVMKHLPASVMLAELAQLLPILVEALRIPLKVDEAETGAALHLAAVASLHMLVAESPEKVADYLNSLIPPLLSFVDPTHGNPLGLRLQALELLASFAALPYLKIQRFKLPVTKGVKKALDDRKRVVRRAAVVTSNAWAVISSD